MIVNAVAAVGRGGGAAAGERAGVAFFGAGGVGAPVFRLLVVESADGADWVVVLADRSSVPIPLAVAAASGFVGGVSDFDLPLAGEEEDVGAHLLSLLRGGGNHHRGGIIEGASIGIWVEELSGGNRETFGVEDSGPEIDEQPFRVTGKVAKRKAMNGELILIRGGAEREPGSGTDREGFVEASCQGREERGVVSGRGRGIDPQESDRAITINLGSKGEGERAVGGTEDFRRAVWEGGGNGVLVWVGGVDLSWCVEPTGGRREGGGFGRAGQGGRSEDGARGRGSLPRFVLGGGGGHLRV